MDCSRNSISGLAQAHFGQKELNAKGSFTMLNMLKQIGVEYNGTPEWYRFGTLVKKKKVTKVATDLKTKQQVTVLRTELAHCSASVLVGEVDAGVRLLVAKSLSEEENPEVYHLFRAE